LWLGWKAIFLIVAAAGCVALIGMHFRLPETLPAPRPLSMKYVFATYRGLLQDRFFLGSALATGFSSAGMFAYIAGSPFVFINLYGVRPERFGWLFGINAAAVVLSAQVNGRVLHGHAPEKLMRNAAFVQGLAGLMLIAVAIFPSGGLFALALPLFLYMSCIGFVFPNAVALALANHGEIAGTASALLGTIQFAMAAVGTVIVSAINASTAMPMAAVICACGIMGIVTHLFMIGSHPAPAHH
jgi:DHA1 family bicyclomycin/chloramphenicol resistance-like MFS transporter